MFPRLAASLLPLACSLFVRYGAQVRKPTFPEQRHPYDPFCGSGTAVIAAEKTGRTCVAMDLDPQYIHVTRTRYRNTWALMRNISTRMEFATCPLIVTDGFDFYEKVIRRVFGPAVLLGQVLKTRRHDRIVQVDRRERMGASWRFEAGLTHSEDSSTLNTSFIERMNLTIRQGSAYLSRRTLSHARSEDKLEEHLELLRCHYNFVRPHGALKFGREVRTPAMQAGLATR